MPTRPTLTTLKLEVRDGVATVTLDRAELLNAFDEQMQGELASVWQYLRHEDDVRAVVLTGSGEKAFCVGIDRAEIPETEYDPFTYEDPGRRLGPKAQGLWKPVVAAVNGMACGGAFYLLGESDIVIAAEHATFFDPHVTYGLPAAFEPVLLTGRVAFGDVLRMTLMGAHERVSAATALRIGLVSEVVAASELMTTATELAAVIASQPPTAVQASLRTMWAARNLTPDQATTLGNVFLQLGSSTKDRLQGQDAFANQPRAKWRLR
ncbi:MAG TPA: enoyl-CoA hydratase/isomerase family protein [Acidimicrobiales bacterium]|nr:enoyl-CoA hydratase/isomerase family protein [Acidimicrobiales bacterium]